MLYNLNTTLNNRSKGFTLIELLVVIAIIGILSAVVLASLNTARVRGREASVKANLNTVGTQAMLYLSDHSNVYGVFNNGTGGAATCPTSGSGSVFHDTTIERAIAAAKANTAGGLAACLSTDAGYVVAVSRPDTTNSTYWCIDSAGAHCGINSIALTQPTCGTCASAN